MNAKAQMAVINDRLAEQHPDTNRGFDVRVYTLAQGMMDIGIGPILALWQASAAFVLLIACANVANLLLARGAERAREMSVRLAIGASRLRIVREQLIESTIVSLVAVPVALAIASVSLDALRNSMPAKIVRFVAGWQELNVDGRLFATAGGGLGFAERTVHQAGVELALLGGRVEPRLMLRVPLDELLEDAGPMVGLGATVRTGR